MEVKTYTVSVMNQNGLVKALKSLDDAVKSDLGTDIRIHSVKDTLYPRSCPSFEDYIARVVVYERPKKD